MELRVLNYFLMVAREENITRAAQLLHVTQPTLSRQLAQLEEELGVKLFERKSHNVILTEEGLLLRRRALEMRLLADKIKNDFSGDNQNLTGEISIGAGELMSVNDLAELIAAFRIQHPLVQFVLMSGNSEEIRDRMDQGLLEVGLLIEPVAIDKYSFVRMPQKERWGVLVPAESPLVQQAEITPADLITYPLLISQNNPIKNELANWFGQLGQELNVVGTYNLLYNAAAMVRQGTGIALCLELAATYTGTTFIPLSPELNLTSVLVWKANQAFSPTTSAFIRFVEKYLKGIS
ncbi:LysR family transcriptional regulator [Enterococcus sp. AZ109]|uniref:LysR family transcriptional regulator n=1 Tax=Enterococcus sp. AZ109 TaxID=2774634 RepID=UPI003F248023